MSSSLTTSTCRIAPLSCTRRVKILDHSLTKGLYSFETIQCDTFFLGGFQWAVLYNPNTRLSGYKNSVTVHVSFYLKLLTEAEHVTVILSFSLATQNAAGALQFDTNTTSTGTFTYTKKGEKKGFEYFMTRSQVDSPTYNYVKDGSIIIQCNLHIIKPSIVTSIPVPPSNLQQHLDHLLQSGEGADVSFKVKGEIIPAHRSILAARSSVFRAELFGSMRESKDECIEIEDMEPEIFKALLHFVYTDILCPSADGQSDQGADEDIMAQHLLVASDRYDLERLKLICENKLAKRISENNVVTTLLLSARHKCQNLGKICLDYISSVKNHSVILKSI